MNEEPEYDNQKALADFEAQKKDYTFFEKGVPFSEVRTCSAKSLFGGKWKDTIRQYLGDEILELLADRINEGKVIDFPLAAFNVGNKSGIFSKGEKISIISKNNQYNGTYEVLATEGEFVIILKGKDKNATGIIINQSRKNGAHKAMEKTAKRLSNLSSLKELDNKKKNKPSKPRLYRYTWLFLIAIILLVVIFSKNE